MAHREVFSEIYPINLESIPKLYAWRLDALSVLSNQIGWKLAYRLNKLLGTHWAWTTIGLITDISTTASTLNKFLGTLREEPAAKFDDIRSFTFALDWQPDALSIAEFVALSLCNELNWKFRNYLQQYSHKIPSATVEREQYISGWNVKNEPGISISVQSSLVSDYSLRDWISRTLDENIIGFLVQDRTSGYKGEITEVIGYLRDNRKRLIGLAKRDKMKELLRDAPDSDLVVKVQNTYNQGYDYIASTLNLLVRTQDYERLNINGQLALNQLQLPPLERNEVVSGIAQIIREKGWITTSPYSVKTAPQQFLTIENVGLNTDARLGDNFVCSSNMTSVLQSLKYHPPFKIPSDFSKNRIIKIGILNLIGDLKSIPTCLNNIRQKLHEIQFVVQFTSAQRPPTHTVSALTNAIASLNSEKPHILIIFIPGKAYLEEDSTYNHIKTITIKADIPTQVVYEDTVENQHAVDNLVLGILAKIGIIPFVLAQKLQYTDLITGIDIARKQTKRKIGSINAVASTRIYSADGNLLRYFLEEIPLEVGILSKETIKRIFPLDIFAKRRVVIHRDGLFRDNELDILSAWFQEINSECYPVEVIKSGVPRLYSFNNQVSNPNVGDIFIINQSEAILVSALPIHKNSTPRPLLIRTKGALPIEQAIHSVLSMTFLHFGSVHPPRLPITIHGSEKFGYMALQGIRPQQLTGTRPYWV